jgi:signal transduction histidine kinase
MKAFEDSDLDRQDVFRDVDVSARDEIGRLGATFKQMADRISAQMRVLRQTDALRRELVANVSHDLRTPIASLHGYLETLLLKDGQLSRQEQQQYLEIALKHSSRLATLVAELFELAKLDAEDINLQREPLALGELVQDVILKSQLAARDAGVTLQSDIPEGLPLVLADIGMIERVLDNLIDNALRHTQSGGTVKLSLSRHPGCVELQVTDTGCGIAQADMHRIFDRFYRSERTGTGKANGAGLGLAIAKRILDLHGSAISVQSELDVGTTFSFSLPAAGSD